jgi:hypothetical protein
LTTSGDPGVYAARGRVLRVTIDDRLLPVPPTLGKSHALDHPDIGLALIDLR